MLYILTSIWWLHTPNTGQNLLFQCFQAKILKKEKKSKKFGAKFSRKSFFLFTPKHWRKVLFSEKTHFHCWRYGFICKKLKNYSKICWLSPIFLLLTKDFWCVQGIFALCFPLWGICSLLCFQGVLGLLLMLGWDVVELRCFSTPRWTLAVISSAKPDLPEGFV